MRSRSSAVLVALAIAACAPSARPSGYTPKWRVGDWWVVRMQVPSMIDNGWDWQVERYDVLRTEKVDGRNCFVLQNGDTASPGSGPRDMYYVRTDSFRVVRKTEYFWQAGRLVGPSTSSYPEGMFGLFPPGLRMPRFPLDNTHAQDSAFHLYDFGIGVTSLRQFSSHADSALLNSYLSASDSSSGRPARLPGTMFSVLTEEGAPRELGDPDVPFGYTLQLWSTDYPWRLYEEWGPYDPPGSNARRSTSRSWLIASGHNRK